MIIIKLATTVNGGHVRSSDLRATAGESAWHTLIVDPLP